MCQTHLSWHAHLGLGFFDLPSRRFLTNDVLTPLTLAPQVTLSYIKGVFPHVIYTLNFEGKETLSECLVIWVCYYLWVYLKCTIPLVAALHHSSWSLLPFQVAEPYLHHPKLLFPFIFLFSIPLYSCVHLCLFDFHFLSFPYMLFNSALFHHHHHIILF